MLTRSPLKKNNFQLSNRSRFSEIAQGLNCHLKLAAVHTKALSSFNDSEGLKLRNGGNLSVSFLGE